MTIAVDRPGAVGFGGVRAMAVGVSAKHGASHWRLRVDVHAQKL